MNIDIKIDEDLKGQATKCSTSLRCLNDRDYELCRVDRSENGGGVLFIECKETKHCNYKNIFGYSLYFCTCPVRKEIYKKYKM